jgi:hypothetical protein
VAKKQLPKSGTERQRRYRAKRKVVSIDVTDGTAARIRALRQKTELSTDGVLQRALATLEDDLDPARHTASRPERAVGRVASKTRKPRKSSPGDERGQTATINKTAAPTRIRAKKEQPQKPLRKGSRRLQGKLDF